MLQLIQGNRIEDLAQALAQVVSQPLSHPLDSECIMVQTQGLGQWLQWQLADQHSVCANVEFPFPATWLWNLYIEFIQSDLPRGVFSKPHMAWLLYRLIPEFESDSDYCQLHDYLHQSQRSRDRFQLVWALADIFDQYLVYRPEWILKWEDGPNDNDWQARVWRRLVAEYRQLSECSVVWHRARLFSTFMERLAALTPDDIEKLPERLLIFGMSSMPPTMIQVLSKLGDYIPVYVFMLNPCEFFWADTPSKKQLLRAYEYPRDDMFHPLLAAMGRCGRDLIHLLADHVSADIPLFEVPEANALLHVLQRSLLDGRLTHNSSALDDSIHINSCHSVRREVEILHDQLLARFAKDASLTPRDVVVMAPDIQQYLPWVKAVFNRFDDERFILWSAADVSRTNRIPLLDTVLELFGLPNHVVTVSQAYDWLCIPAIGDKRELTAEKRAVLMHLLQQSNIHWGLDGQERAQQGYDHYERHTFEFGLDRMFMGAFMGDHDASKGEVYPLPLHDDISLDVAVMLDEWVREIADWKSDLAQEKTARQWCEWISSWLDSVFEGSDEVAIMTAAVRDILVQWVKSVEAAGCDQVLDHSVVYEVLRGEFGQRDAGIAFLGRGVTFCSLTPMRSIPFKVVCLLGMNEGDFPRYTPPVDFDRMADFPKTGDRIRKEEDRYLFLEALLSARESLYISYIGRNARDNTVRLPSSVVTELMNAMARLVGEPSASFISRCVIEHPLHPFDDRYFSGDPSFITFVGEWVGPARTFEVASACQRTNPDGKEQRLEWADLQRFWRHPLQHFGRYHLKLADRKSGAAFSDVEPQTANALDVYRWNDSLIHDGMTMHGLIDTDGRWIGSGEMMEVAASQYELANYRQGVDQWFEEHGAQYQWNLSIETFSLLLGSAELNGEFRLGGVGQFVRVQPNRLQWHQRLLYWLEWLVACAVHPLEQADIWSVTDRRTFKREVFHRPDDPVALLSEYADLFYEGCSKPLYFFPKYHGDIFDRCHINGKPFRSVESVAKDPYSIRMSPLHDRWVQLLNSDAGQWAESSVHRMNSQVFEPIVSYWSAP